MPASGITCRFQLATTFGLVHGPRGVLCLQDISVSNYPPCLGNDFPSLHVLEGILPPSPSGLLSSLACFLEKKNARDVVTRISLQRCDKWRMSKKLLVDITAPERRDWQLTSYRRMAKHIRRLSSRRCCLHTPSHLLRHSSAIRLSCRISL